MIRAGLYLLAKEFRYITILRIILLFTKHYKKSYKKIFSYQIWYGAHIKLYTFLKKLHNFVFLINSRSF